MRNDPTHNEKGEILDAFIVKLVSNKTYGATRESRKLTVAAHSQKEAVERALITYPTGWIVDDVQILSQPLNAI